MHPEIGYESLKEKDRLDDLGVDGKKTSKPADKYKLCLNGLSEKVGFCPLLPEKGGRTGLRNAMFRGFYILFRQ